MAILKSLGEALAWALVFGALFAGLFIPEPRWYNGRWVWGSVPEYDDPVYRCEGDCPPSLPCRFCNP